MKTKTPYIFFSDLDETLLTTDKQISARTYEALRLFCEAGNRFAICTGRGLDSAQRVMEELKLDFPGTYICATNGTLLYDCGNDSIIFKKGLDPAIVEKIFRIARECGVYVQTYNRDRILAPCDSEELAYYVKVIKTPPLIADEPWKYLDEAPCKMLCIELHDHEKQDIFHRTIREAFADTIDTVYSNPYYLEIIPKGCGKGSAVTRLADYLGIPVSRTIAAGDEENDISMIRAAGLGIAMCNGNPSARAAADTVTSADNNHDGLAEYFEKFT